MIWTNQKWYEKASSAQGLIHHVISYDCKTVDRFGESWNSLFLQNAAIFSVINNEIYVIKVKRYTVWQLTITFMTKINHYPVTTCSKWSCQKPTSISRVYWYPWQKDLKMESVYGHANFQIVQACKINVHTYW